MTACGEQLPPAPAGTPAPDTPAITANETNETATPAPTALPPTPTPELAALVNGQPILRETFEKELIRYEMGLAELGITPGADGVDYRRLVLDALIERELISQAAQLAGISVAPESVEAKMADLRQTASESGSFDEWLVANNWTDEEFREALAAEMLVEEMIASITAEVPYTAEQVRASYLQVDDAALADSLLIEIRDGADFAALAAEHSRDVITAPAGGDLGFFARGSLLVPEVEEAAFRLPAGEVSDVITSTDADSGKVTYYIIKVTERESDRPLNTDLRYQLLQDTFSSWLDSLRARATIVTLLDEE